MAQRGPAKSHRLGLGTLADGTTTVVYRAAVVLDCTPCQRPNEPGALFTRRSQPVPFGVQGVRLRTLPVCRACRPFRFGADDAAAGAADDTAAPTLEDDHG